MGSAAHVKELVNKHTKLDAQIQTELKSPAAETNRSISELTLALGPL